eukprot:761882-Hanusia_phi.AAC.4
MATLSHKPLPSPCGRRVQAWSCHGPEALPSWTPRSELIQGGTRSPGGSSGAGCQVDTSAGG